MKACVSLMLNDGSVSKCLVFSLCSVRNKDSENRCHVYCLFTCSLVKLVFI